MPPITRRFIKVAFIYFLVALTLKGIQSFTHGQFLCLGAVVYYHLLLVGWITQLIFGIVYWMFPKASVSHPRGPEAVWEAIFWLINIGLLLRIIGEPWQQCNPGWLSALLLMISSLTQWASGMLFVGINWRRVRGK